MANVLIVGFGNIGLRHFESIVNFKKIKKIFIYDINYTKLITFKKKLIHKNKNKIVILKNLNQNKKKFLLSIIATNSNVRFSLFQKIVNNFKVKHFILEKIVFQHPNEFDSTKEIIKKEKIKCWINCPRRTWSIFKNLKKKILRKKKISIFIYGSRWGIISNTMHFIDLFIFLTEARNIKLDLNKLSKKFYKTKRKGFFDTTGRIKVINSLGHKLTLIDDQNSDKNKFIFKLIQKNYHFYYDQNNLKNKFKVPYQSSETIKHLKNILKKGSCNLPSYTKTYKFHKMFSEDICKFAQTRKNRILFT